MKKVKQVFREIVVQKTMEDTKNTLLLRLEILSGKVVNITDTNIECDFGSLSESRLIGEFWVAKEILPKRVSIRLEPIDNFSTKINLNIYDTHNYGILWGVTKKYELALTELANSILVIFDSMFRV